MLRIKKKDKVVVKTGKDKGKQGEVTKVFPKSQRATVTKINIVKKHTRPGQRNPGGVIDVEASVHLSNLMLICPKCSQPTKVKFDWLEDGEKIRICKKCGEMVV